MEEHETIQVDWFGQKSFEVPVEAAQIIRLNALIKFEKNLRILFRRHCRTEEAERDLHKVLRLAWEAMRE